MTASTFAVVRPLRDEKQVLSIRKLTAGPVQVGTRAVMVRKEMRRVSESEYEVSEFVPGRRIAFIHPQDAMDFALRVALTPKDDGWCDLTVEVSAQPKGALRLAEPLMRLGFPRRSRSITDAMVGVIESIATSGKSTNATTTG